MSMKTSFARSPDGYSREICSLPCRTGKVGYEEDWMGAPMFWGGLGAEVYIGMVEKAGLSSSPPESTTGPTTTISCGSSPASRYNS